MLLSLLSVRHKDDEENRISFNKRYPLDSGNIEHFNIVFYIIKLFHWNK